MVEAYEKETSFNDKKEIESKLENNLTSSVLKRLIGQKEDKSKTIDSRTALAFLGVVGLYVATPTVIGAYVGNWLDKAYPHQVVSWSLNLILLGVVVGVFSAAQWLKKEAISKAVFQQKKRQSQLDKIKTSLSENERVAHDDL